MKLCTKCGETKENLEFSKCTSKVDGLQIKCKACVKEYQQANKDAIAIRGVEYRQNNKEAIAVYQAEYKQANKETLAVYHVEYQKANKETLAVYMVEYYQDNKEVLAIKQAEYAKTPIGKLISKNAAHKRRAICKEGSVTTEQLQELVATATNCHYCKCAITDDNRHIDHVIPLSKGGLHDIQNLVIACATCNHRKHAKMPEEFIETLSEADQERLKLQKS